MTKYSKFTLLALVMALALFSVAGPSQAAIQTAGSLAINLDAETLSAGAFTTWSNTGTGAGTFAPDPSSPDPTKITVTSITRGQSGLAKKAVAIDNGNAVNTRPINALRWSKLTQDLFGGVASSFSLEIWVYNEQYTDYEGLASFAPRDIGNHWISFWQENADPAVGNSRIVYGTFGGCVSTAPFISPRQPAAGGTFNLWTYVYNKGTGILKAYVNGKFYKQSETAVPNASIIADWYVHLGGYGRQNPTEAGAGLTGAIAKARVHTDALTASQVWGNFTTEAPDYILAANMPAPPDPETAGSLLINLNAETLALANGAEVTAWPNAGTAGGTFVPDPAPASGTIGTPNMATLSIGHTGAPKKVVRFQAVAPGDFSAANVDCLQLDAAQVPTALTSDAPTFSVEFWAYKVGTFGNQSAVSWGRRAQSDYRDPSPVTGSSGAAAAYFHTATAVSGRAITIGDGTDPDGFPAFGAGYTPVFSKFTHFTYTYNTANKQLKFYINGVPNRSMTCNNWWPATGFPMYLGMSRATYGSNGGNPLGGIAWSTEEERRAACLNFLHSGLDGGIAKLRIHSGVLTPGQVYGNFIIDAADYMLAADIPALPFEAPVFGENSADFELGKPSTWGPPVLTNLDRLSGSPTWALVSPPAGMTIDPATGVISWTSPSPLGETLVTVSAETADGKTEGTVTVNVLPAPALPVVVPYPADIIALDAGTLSYGSSPTSWVNYASNATLVGNFTAESAKLSVVQVENSTARAVVFDGTDQAALKSANVAPSEITGNHAWTVELWLNSALAADERWAFAWGHRWGPDNTCACLGYGSNGTWGAFGGWGAGDMGYAGGTLPQLNAWHHVVLTYAGGTDGNLTLYVDAAQNNQQTKTLNTHGPDDGETIPVFVGGSYDGPDWLSAATANFLNFTGMISRVRVHSSALSAGQVAANYAAEKPDFTSVASLVVTKPTMFDILVFWDAAVGETSAGQDFAFRNDGDLDLTITNVALNGEFEIDPEMTTPIVVPGHSEYAVSVITAVPTVAGPQEGSLVLDYDNGVDTGTYTLDLLVNPSAAYVSMTGNDTTGNGTEGAPFRTIQKAIDVGRNIGSSIQVLAGSYASFSVPGTADTFMKIAAPAGGVTVTDGPVSFAAAADKTTVVETDGLSFQPTTAPADTPVIAIGGAGTQVVTIKNGTISSAGMATKAPNLIGAGNAFTGGVTLTVEDCTLNGADVSNGVFFAAGAVTDITVLKSAINHTRNGVIKYQAAGNLLVRECTFDTATGRFVTGTAQPFNDGGGWWWPTSGDLTVDRCYFLNGGGAYDDFGDADMRKYTVVLFSEPGQERITNCVWEGCDRGPREGWSNGDVINNTIVAHSGLADTAEFGMFVNGGCRRLNNVVLGFPVPFNVDDDVNPGPQASNFDDVAQAGPPELNPNFKYQSGAAYALPTGIVGVTGFIPVAPSALTGAGVYAAGVPRVDYYGGARSFTAPYVGAFEGVWSAPAIQAIATQIAVLGRPFSTLTPTLTAGYPPSTWTLNAAAITAGMTVDSETGVVSWANPGPVAQYPVTLTATNAAGADSVSFTVKVLSQPPAAATYWYLFE